MQIKKSFHFYAAHRNELLRDKCFNLHGHTYYVDCTFHVSRGADDPNITMLFSEFNPIDEWLKTHWDHGLFMSAQDPLLPYLDKFMDEQQSPMKIYVLPRATSVENICYELFRVLLEMGYKASSISIRETNTSTVTYTRADYDTDIIYFSEEPKECEHEVSNVTGNCIHCGKTAWTLKLERLRKNREERTTN